MNPNWHLGRPSEFAATPVVVLPTATSTYEFGRDRLAPALEPGDLIIASGPLGVGKTALIQGIGAGLGVAERVLSPTFVIARVHRGGRIRLVHVDAYRLSSVREIDDLDLDAEVAESVTAVEWGQGLVEQLTEEHLLIELSLGDETAGSLHNRPFAGPESAGSLHNRLLDGDELRIATLTPYGAGWQARLPAIMEL
ncbi:MAG: tRNA (adenosine(37)-N6)-threonylcarbamoyltransferase complex ATPase subunit type 1 TsaE [Geodermatophilaceae bacterium]|nr:tRNA (adenosine(37)-N6)-threonylcarbamoyltransferase complex ATPase subunit type 1 TsaE [Geodermatophilaceae bacterium]